MKIIAQYVAERMSLIPVDKSGRPDSFEASQLMAVQHAVFWHRIENLVGSCDRRLAPGLRASAFYEPARGRASASAMRADHLRMKKFLKVDRLTLGTGLRLRGLFCDLLQKVMTHDDVDKAFCALVAFVQLELEGELDPEYGAFPTPAARSDTFNDEDWDDGLAELLAEAAGDYDHFGRAECRKVIRFRQWEKTIEAPAKFEKAFPGMGHRRGNLARAMRPIFKHLDPVLDFQVLDLCLGWIAPLMKSQFEENRLAALLSAPTPDQQAA
jgi:hypothetical protein